MTPREKKGLQNNISIFANKLMKFDYLELFQGKDEIALDALWNEPKASDTLALLALDPEIPVLAQFLASEIMFYKQKDYPPNDFKKQLASIYALALAQNFTVAANAWVLPDVFIGLAGEHLLALGEAAVPELANLLDDSKRVYFEGSKEATLGNSYGYRVKDLAAFFISKIKSIPLKMDAYPHKRDNEIKKLKNLIENDLRTFNYER